MSQSLVEASVAVEASFFENATDESSFSGSSSAESSPIRLRQQSTENAAPKGGLLARVSMRSSSGVSETSILADESPKTSPVPTTITYNATAPSRHLQLMRGYNPLTPIDESVQPIGEESRRHSTVSRDDGFIDDYEPFMSATKKRNSALADLSSCSDVIGVGDRKRARPNEPSSDLLDWLAQSDVSGMPPHLWPPPTMAGLRPAIQFRPQQPPRPLDTFPSNPWMEPMTKLDGNTRLGSSVQRWSKQSLPLLYADEESSDDSGDDEFNEMWAERTVLAKPPHGYGASQNTNESMPSAPASQELATDNDPKSQDSMGSTEPRSSDSSGLLTDVSYSSDECIISPAMAARVQSVVCSPSAPVDVDSFDIGGVQWNLSPRTAEYLTGGEFVGDIFNVIRARELGSRPAKWLNDSATGDGALAVRRRQFMTRLLKQRPTLGVCLTTIHLAARLLDHFSVVYACKDGGVYEDAAIVCLVLATKMEEYDSVRFPKAAQLLRDTARAEEWRNFARLEKILYQNLAFDTDAPTSFLVANLLHAVVGSSKQQVHLANFLLELALLDWTVSSTIRPSVVAFAAVVISHAIAHEEPGGKSLSSTESHALAHATLSAFTAIDVSEALELEGKLIEMFENAPTDSSSVYDVYCRESELYVAFFEVPCSLATMISAQA